MISKTFISKTVARTLLSLFFIAAIGVASLATTTISPLKASAFTTSLTQSVVNHCKSKAAKKLDNACTDDVATKALNVATYHCDATETPSKKYDCLSGNANTYIDKTIKKKPSSIDDFNKEFDKILKSAHGSTKNPQNGFDDSTIGDCDPHADGRCPNCSSNNKTDGCIDCSVDNCADSAVNCTSDDCDLIAKWLNPAIQLVTVLFGLIAVASLIYGSIAYASSEGDPSKATKAKDRIAKTFFAIIAYMFLYAFLQFLIPGGIF